MRQDMTIGSLYKKNVEFDREDGKLRSIIFQTSDSDIQIRIFLSRQIQNEIKEQIEANQEGQQ